MDVRLLFPTLYLSAADFRGNEATLTIARVAVEDLRTNNGSEKKPVVFFEETRAKAAKNGDARKEKRLVLNKTNAMTIAGIYGNEVDRWAGKRVTLFPTTCEAFGETVDCIRVKPHAPPPPQGSSKPEPQVVELGVATATGSAPAMGNGGKRTDEYAALWEDAMEGARDEH